MGIIIINPYAVTTAASATAGITTSIVSDGDSDGDLLGTSNNFMNDGEVLQVQYSGSGGSSVTYTVTKSGTGLSIGTLTDVAARNVMKVLAYKGNSNQSDASAADVTLSGSSGAVHTTIEETGTFFIKVNNPTGADFDVVINQNVDSGAATATATITVVDNS